MHLDSFNNVYYLNGNFADMFIISRELYSNLSKTSKKFITC